MRSKLVISLILIFLISLTEPLSIFAAKKKRKSKKTSEEKEVVAVITQVRGRLDLQRSGKKKWKKAKSGTFLYEGDRIRTAKKSKAVIVFYNGTQLKIAEKTEFSVEKTKLTLKKEKRNRIRLRRGRAMFGTRAKARRLRFDINTPVAVVSIRGTRGLVKVIDESATFVLVTQGKVTVGNEFGKITLKKGQKTTVSSGNPPEKPKKVTKEEEKKETDWQKDIKINKKNLKLKIKTEEDEEKTLRLKFER